MRGPDCLSFKDWDADQPIPDFQDQVSGHPLTRPHRSLMKEDTAKPVGYPYVQPNDARFGPPSVVKVPYHSVASEKPISATTADELVLFDEQPLDKG